MAALQTPSPFAGTARRFAPRLRYLLLPTTMSLSSSIVSSRSRDGDGEQPLLPHSSLEIAGARRGLLAGFDSLRRPYRAFPVFASNRHVETIFAAFTRSLPTVAFRRECLRTPDDGAVALDWVSGDDRALPGDAPVLILLVWRRFPSPVLLFLLLVAAILSLPVVRLCFLHFLSCNKDQK